jgi:GT2 family glycosyltransferase
MDISIIIPNYNGAVLLKNNLPKVLKALSLYKKGKTEIIIVDDFSTDNSLDVIKDKNIIVLKNEKNLGFSSTINKGVKKAVGEVVILLNTDVYPQENFLEPLLEHFIDEKVFAVGCLDKSIEGEKTVLRGRGLGKWEKGFLVHRRGEVDKTNTLWVSGGSGAFRKSIWDKLGGLNELYNPFYWEDIDLSYRALKSGYKVLFESKSIVIHEHGEGAIIKKYSKKQITTISFRNQFIFSWENATDYNLQAAEFFYLPYHFIKAILRFDLPFFIGFFKALILLPKVIKSSLRNQKLFIKSDKQLLADIA